jgi:hypothetical protein
MIHSPMRFVIPAAALIAALWVGGADAQVDPPAQAAPAATPPQPAKPDGHTVSGITVEGSKAPAKSCSSRDKDCVAVIVAELKARYPKELQHWCDLVEYRAANTNMTMDQLNGIGTSFSPGQTSVYGRFAPPAVAKLACAPDKK